MHSSKHYQKREIITLVLISVMEPDLHDHEYKNY